MSEVWCIVPSAPDLLASSEGRIMVAHYCSLLGSRPTYRSPGTLGQWDGKRYIYCRHGRRTLKVARLVCEAFHGTPPLPDSVCMHLDENSSNNRPENLSWGTQRQNLNAPGFLQYCRSRTGENNPFLKGRSRP